MAAHDLMDAFTEELRDILSAEKQITKALPKMAKKASSDELRRAFEEHLEQTEQQVERLKQAFESLDITPRAKKCEAMEGLLAEGEQLLKEGEQGSALDAMMIAAAQKVEHYEIASYGTLCTWGKLMGCDEAVELLKQNMNEEEETDQKLTELAETINQEAMAGQTDES